MKHALTHFGLADATAIDSVEIRWPSGAIDVLKNLQADKFPIPSLKARVLFAPFRFVLLPLPDRLSATFASPLS